MDLLLAIRYRKMTVNTQNKSYFSMIRDARANSSNEYEEDWIISELRINSIFNTKIQLKNKTWIENV